MAYYFVFASLKNCPVEKIAENIIEKDYFLKFFPEGKSVECSLTDFTDVQKTIKNCFLDENGNVILKNNEEKYSFSQSFNDVVTNENITVNRTLAELQKLFKSNINLQISAVSSYICNYPNDVVWNSYINKLKLIDVNSISFPIEKPFQAWFLEQEGVPNKSILQIP